MAEFCLKCWNEINGTNDSPNKYILSHDLEICEKCGKTTHVIIMERKQYHKNKFRFVIFPVKIVFAILVFLLRALALPYLIYKQKKNQKDRSPK